MPKFVVLDDETIRCSGIAIEWCPMMKAGDAGNAAITLDPDDTVPWEFGAPGTAPDPDELTATVVRSFAVASLIARARASLPSLEGLASAMDAATDPSDDGQGRPRRNFIKDNSPRRKKRLDQVHYELVARIYRRAERHPRKEVAREFAVELSTASDYIEECRRRGLLPPTTKGKSAK